MLTKRQSTQWVIELRAPSYQQGKGSLSLVHCNDDGVLEQTKCCCLGLYLAAVEGIPVRDMEGIAVPSEMEGRGTTFAEAIVEYEMYDSDGNRIPVSGEELFARLNDGLEWSFDQIADFIETLPTKD